MARRLTSKQEAFAALVAGGKSPPEAYKIAYAAQRMKQASVERESRTLLKNPLIAPWVQELQSKALESTREVIEVNAAAALVANAALAFSDIGKIYNEHGHLLHPHEMDPQTRAAIASIKTRRIELGNDKGAMVIDEVRFWDKGAAIDRFLKHFGAYEKDNKQKAATPFDDLPREVAKLIVERLRGLSGPVVG